MKKVFAFTLALSIFISMCGCGKTASPTTEATPSDVTELPTVTVTQEPTIIETTPTEKPTAETTATTENLAFLSVFVERYNVCVRTGEEIGTITSYITLADAKSGSFKPNSWSSFDIHIDDDGNLEKIIFAGKGASAFENADNLMELLIIISAIIEGVDEEITADQYTPYIDGIFGYDFSSSSSHSCVINGYRYELDEEFGYIRFIATPEP